MAKKPQTLIRERTGISPVLARLIQSAPTTTIRDNVYIRGFSLEHDRDFRAVGKLECMKMGLISFKMRKDDLEPDNTNVQGSVILNAIYNGVYLEAFRATSEQVGIQHEVPTAKALLNKAQYFAVAPRVFMEVENGFAPYVFVGYREEGYSYPVIVRIQINLEHARTKEWFTELQRAAKKFVY